MHWDIQILIKVLLYEHKVNGVHSLFVIAVEEAEVRIVDLRTYIMVVRQALDVYDARRDLLQNLNEFVLLLERLIIAFYLKTLDRAAFNCKNTCSFFSKARLSS